MPLATQQIASMKRILMKTHRLIHRDRRALKGSNKISNLTSLYDQIASIFYDLTI